jgi:hypothetical protein
MINLLSTFYISKSNSHLDNLRTEELINALLKNLECPNVEMIHLFVDDYEAFEKLNSLTNNSNKIKVIEIGKKPKYIDFFKYILENLQEKICMISNADIYLYECDMNLIDLLKDKKHVYALTRYEHDMSHPLIDDYGGSHDSYIFNSKFLNEIDLKDQDINFYQNKTGIESRILRFFYNMKFKLYNPCKQIKIVHLHKSQLRNYGPSIGFYFYEDWVGLHKIGDFEFHKNSIWWVPPTII